ncbi:hypothetical protein LOZ53_003785 [Ophidiomyces ophidiicola]|nr:hypothetical protein LOZ55_006559 [Ophidiomyces ophidiicola]KAI1983001.1 hypothetical protein LOZ54_005136 [Ophidiomyces ophidiicola]KAI1985437.1 hypothetical protein LOZ51_006348 [Ophidiomyces ophidiicola]KAI1988784.1 hypothetical protein LOZ53_003785 [Ophidiomyces ophidiicola]
MTEHATLDVFKVLESEYCPPLDPALFAAIAHDYDCDENFDNINELRTTLNELKAFAEAQDDCTFDPSGTSGQGFCDGDGAPSASIHSSQKTLQSLESAISSLGSTFSASSLGRDESTGGHSSQAKSQRMFAIPSSIQPGGAFSNLGPDGRQEYLQEMFPSIKPYTIAHTLGKFNYDIDKSMDVLLNLAFFDDYREGDNSQMNFESISIPKGIEGFGEGSGSTKGRRKGKGKRKQGKTNGFLEQYSATYTENGPTGNSKVNRWDNGKKDVDFICSRTLLSSQAVGSAYYSNGGHLPTTIRYLALKEAEKHPDKLMNNPVTVQQIAELLEDFSTSDTPRLAGLLKLTRNSISAAKELLEVMVMEPETPSTNIEPAKPGLPTTKDSKYLEVKRASGSIRPLPLTSNSHTSFAVSHALADHHRRIGETAFDKAQAAYRRGKSDHLMGAAASYYSGIGREHIALAKREASAAADALVDSQSTRKTLDLHGVSVQDGVRIASDRVEIWWESLGDAKYVTSGGRPAQEGYRIITGLGRHSKNGMARLGPAVARKLASQGWKVEVGEGQLTVTGLVRHS